MAIAAEPRVELAKTVLPGPLLEAIEHVFAQGISGCMLVGGTALAGFYAGHRRSDDMDLFTEDAASQKAAVLAALSLSRLGAELQVAQNSAQYCRAACRFRAHRFTIDVALHPGLSALGRAITLPDGVSIASLEVLAMMKAAALLSRCAEKDLYDLLWMRRRDQSLSAKRLMALGSRIDAGMSAEGLLIALAGVELSVESCGFSLNPADNAPRVLERVSAFRDELVRELIALAEREPAPPLAALIKRVRRMLKD